jgi:hypothetical protein
MEVKISSKLNARDMVVPVHGTSRSIGNVRGAYGTSMARLAAGTFNRTEVMDVQRGQTPLLDPAVDHRFDQLTQPTCALVVHDPALLAVLAWHRTLVHQDDTSHRFLRRLTELSNVP